jgi:hypothetical protein
MSLVTTVPNPKEETSLQNSSHLDDSELSERDLPESELHHYIRTDEEIKTLSSLLNE